MQRTVQRTAIFLGIVALILLYGFFDPATHPFPKCPFLWLTGLKCPGCGSQRAIHYLLTLQLGEAFRVHPLMLPALPYVLFGLALEYTSLGVHYSHLRRRFYGLTAIRVVFIIVVSFWILRNIFGF